MGLTGRILLSIMLYLVVQWAGPVQAQSTADGCSCDLVSRYKPGSTDHDKRDGADVIGATSCYLSVHREREWCTFDLVTQRGDGEDEQRHREIVNDLISAVTADDVIGVVKRLQFEFSRAFDVRPSVVRDRAVLTELLRRLGANQKTLFSCAHAFEPGSGGRSNRLSTTTGDFACGVHPGGWLTLFFSFDQSSVFYLLAPLDG